MTIGDLVKYNPLECNNQIAGMVMGYERTDSLLYLHVQWFDWDDGQIAVENPDALVLVSKANENRRFSIESLGEPRARFCGLGTCD